jgi:apolipoprotein N-acyltransferase
MPRRTLFILAVVSALLVTASFPPFGLGMLVWFGLSPLFLALRQGSHPTAAALAFLFGSLFFSGTFYWVNSIAGVNPANFLIVTIFFGLYFCVFGFLYRLTSVSLGSWIIVGAPALWVAMEYARSNLFFLSWPWNLLGHSQYHYLPVIQIADITGVYGISYLIVMVNQVLSQVPDFIAMRRGTKTDDLKEGARGINWAAHLLVMFLALGLTFFYGWHKLIEPDGGKYLRVALVQPNVITRSKMSYADQKKHLGVYFRLTREAAEKDPALVVWPSSSLPAPLNYSRLVRYSVNRLAHETGVYLLVGGTGRDKLEHKKKGYLPYSNREYLISPSGRRQGQYDKIRLVPFDEYLPLQGRIKWPEWITTLQESFIPGKEYTLFKVAGARFATPICWENMFPDLFRRFVMDGAQFMVSVTNEAFMDHTPAPYQTLAINVFRAAENRVAVIRSTPTGVSAFINPDGEIVEKVQDDSGKDLSVSGFLVRDVPLSNKKTWYTIYGDIFAYSVIGIAALLIVASLVGSKTSNSLIEQRT